MTILYSKSSHESGESSGFYLSSDRNHPIDCIKISDEDHSIAINLTAGYTYSFSEDGKLTTNKPDAIFLLDQAKNIQIELMNSAYYDAIYEPISYTSDGGITSVYDANQTSIDNLQNCLLGFSYDPTLMPESFFWVDANNKHIPFTYTDVQKLASTMILRGSAAFANLQDRKSKIRLAKKVSDVKSIVW